MSAKENSKFEVQTTVDPDGTVHVIMVPLETKQSSNTSGKKEQK